MLRAALALCLIAILSLPFLARQVVGTNDGPSAARVGPEATLIVVTPHVEQIREEFAWAFAAWHKRKYGSDVAIDWRAPGGTTEIIKLLEAQFSDRLKSGLLKPDGSCAPGTIDFDVMMGGGSFDHTRLRNGLTIPDPAAKEPGPDGKPKTLKVPYSIPPAPVFSEAELTAVFGENKIGAGQLFYDNRAKGGPDDWQYWIGTALSGFGIVYNRDVLKEVGITADPKSFEDLRDSRLMGLIALADPRQSGSVATAYDSILNEAARANIAKAKADGLPEAEATAKGQAQGWAAGWNTLRDICGNARYFTSSSTQPPIDVSQGDAAAALCIDFYGRGQEQAIAGGGPRAQNRVGYVDPAGAVYIDADPVSIIRGGPNPALARRFVEFCLTEEAQCLWQLPVRGMAAAGGDQLGPIKSRLRRLPVRRDVYTKHFAQFADPVDPFKLASQAKPVGWRSGMIVMMGCFGVDANAELKRATKAMHAARLDPKFPTKTLAKMTELYYSFPKHTMADGRELEFNSTNYRAISDDVKSWTDPARTARVRIGYTTYYRSTFDQVAKLFAEAKAEQ